MTNCFLIHKYLVTNWNKYIIYLFHSLTKNLQESIKKPVSHSDLHLQLLHSC